MERIIHLVTNGEVLLKLDESLNQIEVVDKLPLDTMIYHLEHHKVLIANPRDHCLISTIVRVRLCS